MVNVEIKTLRGSAIGFSATGHAMYADPGQDIVCSAVSAVVQTALLGLLDVVQIETEYSIDDNGYIDCIVFNTDDVLKREKADLVIRVMQSGLCNISENYSKYLRVSEREVTI